MKPKASPDERLLRIVQDPAYEVANGIPPVEHQHGSVRRLTHEGHVIEIHTRYEIVIDGEQYPDPFHVMNDGSVSYHGLPQYSTGSAVDLVKRIVDDLLDEEPPPIEDSPDIDHEHDHNGDH